MLLKQQYKELLLGIFAKKINKKFSVLVYGSRVNGRAHSGSDLDLVIKAEQELNIDELMSLKESLAESNIPFLVDVLDWNRIPDYFKENILKNYEVLK